MSKCDAQNCRNPVATKPVLDTRRSHGYASSSPYQELIPSRWCMKHTCHSFFRNGGACQAKKSPHDSVCAQHTRCPINGCNMGKLQFIDQDSDDQLAHYTRFDFCALHKCDIAMCTEPAVQADQKPGYLPYCKKHRCGYQDCDQQSGEKINFCPKHKCKMPECRTLAEDGFQLCSRHIVCDAPGCNAAKLEDKVKKEYHKLCALHLKCDVTVCDAFKITGSKYCVRHACTERGCIKATELSSPYCEEHRCRDPGCDSPRCWVEKTIRGLYCCMHTCRSDDCEDLVDARRLYCGDHECSKHECLTEAVWEGLCGQHLRLKYDTEAKATARTKIDDLTRQLHEKEQMLIQVRVRQLVEQPHHQQQQMIPLAHSQYSSAPSSSHPLDQLTPTSFVHVNNTTTPISAGGEGGIMLSTPAPARTSPPTPTSTTPAEVAAARRQSQMLADDERRSPLVASARKLMAADAGHGHGQTVPVRPVSGISGSGLGNGRVGGATSGAAVSFLAPSGEVVKGGV